MRSVSSFAQLSDADLTKEVARLLRAERGATVDLVASLAEFDRRRLFLPAGFSSLYAYCRDFLHLGDGAWSVSFQSRLGKQPWVKPYTDLVLPELAQKGVKRLAVFCPAFVTDCLETLEEIRPHATV